MPPSFSRRIPRSCWKRPPKERPVTQDLDKNLIAILDYIKDCKLTFGSFIEACLSSDTIEVKRKIDRFYSDGFPARCLDHWKGAMNGEHASSLVRSATDVVTKYAKSEIKEASHSMNLRFSATSVTEEALDQFDLQVVERELDEHAPISLALIRALVNDKRASPFDTQILAVPVIASIVAKTWNLRANFLQGIFAFYFYSQGATKSLINVLQKAGITNSFDWVLDGLDHLTLAHLAKVQAIVKDRR